MIKNNKSQLRDKKIIESSQLLKRNPKNLNLNQLTNKINKRKTVKNPRKINKPKTNNKNHAQDPKNRN